MGGGRYAALPLMARFAHLLKGVAIVFVAAFLMIAGDRAANVSDVSRSGRNSLDARSIEVLEVSPDPGGLPRYPLKALLLVAFVLLLVQGIAQAIHAASRLRE